MALRIGRSETACKFQSVRRVSERPTKWLYNIFKHKRIANLALKIHYLGPRFPLFHSVRFVPFYNIIKPKRIANLASKIHYLGPDFRFFRASDSCCFTILLSAKRISKLDLKMIIVCRGRNVFRASDSDHCKILLKIKKGNMGHLINNIRLDTLVVPEHPGTQVPGFAPQI